MMISVYALINKIADHIKDRFCEKLLNSGRNWHDFQTRTLSKCVMELCYEYDLKLQMDGFNTKIDVVLYGPKLCMSIEQEIIYFLYNPGV